MTWGLEDPAEEEDRKPLRRDGQAGPANAEVKLTGEALALRLAEELDYARRMLDSLGDQLAADPILIRRHAMSLQSLDIVAQILGHVRNVIRSNDPLATVEDIGMSDLKARLMRKGAL